DPRRPQPRGHARRHRQGRRDCDPRPRAGRLRTESTGHPSHGHPGNADRDGTAQVDRSEVVSVPGGSVHHRAGSVGGNQRVGGSCIPPQGPAAEEGIDMELHERIQAAQTAEPENTDQRVDPFAELKTRLHLAIISELGPQLYNSGGDPKLLHDRVVGEIRERPDAETGPSREDRPRLQHEIQSDTLGYGPIEPLLTDDSVSEVMINGPYDVWLERDGLLSKTPYTFNDESHLRRIINKMVGQIGRRIDESSPMVDARLPDGSRVNA